jgi:hypothetical protein
LKLRRVLTNMILRGKRTTLRPLVIFDRAILDGDSTVRAISYGSGVRWSSPEWSAELLLTRNATGPRLNDGSQLLFRLSYRTAFDAR